MKFKKVKSNVWHKPIMNLYKMACCDCGLVHNMSFRVIDSNSEKIIKNGRVLIKATRNEKLTKKHRKMENKEQTYLFKDKSILFNNHSIGFNANSEVAARKKLKKIFKNTHQNFDLDCIMPVSKFKRSHLN